MSEDKKIKRNYKNEIIKDWISEIPSLGKHNTMSILNRLGPVLVGIYIKFDSNQTTYYPTYHVHNLCTNDDGINLTLNIRGRGIDVSKHDDEYKDVARKLIESAFVPLEGNIMLDDIIKGYEKYFQNPNLGSYTEFEDLVLICGWCGNEEKLNYSLNLVKSILKNWPEERYFYDVGGFDGWCRNIERRARDKETLRKICEQQIISLKATKLPVRELIY